MNIDNNENVIGERIKRFRSYTLNMNQRQFAEALGIQPSTLSGSLIANRNATLPTSIKL